MSFRARLALVAAAAVALAVIVASGVVYFVVKGQLYSSVDTALRNSMERIEHSTGVFSPLGERQAEGRDQLVVRGARADVPVGDAAEKRECVAVGLVEKGVVVQLASHA